MHSEPAPICFQIPIYRSVSYIRDIARPVRTLVVAIPDIFQKPWGISVCGARQKLRLTVQARFSPTAAPAAPLLHLPPAAQRLATTSAYGLLAMTVEYRNCSINWNLLRPTLAAEVDVQLVLHVIGHGALHGADGGGGHAVGKGNNKGNVL